MGPVSRAPRCGQAPRRCCADFGYAPADKRRLHVVFIHKHWALDSDASQQWGVAKIQIECGHYKKINLKLTNSFKITIH
jgi:hypothetical protein